MKTMNLRPALKCRLSDLLKSAGLFYGVMILVLIFSFVVLQIAITRGSDTRGNFSAYGMAATICTFVLGITVIRADLRLFLQNGVGRRTTFVAEFCSMVVIALGLAVAGELLVTAAQAVFAGSTSNFIVVDLYQLMFANGNYAVLSLTQHIESIACFFTLFFSAFLCGSFISMVYYRLNTLWTVLISIAVPVLIFAVGPYIFIWLAQFQVFMDLIALIGRMIAGSPWTFSLLFLIIGLVFALLTWLLMRRAPVKPAKG